MMPITGPKLSSRITFMVWSTFTSTVGSNWAVRRPSAVTAVQPSSHILCCQVPSVIIGSIVNVMPGRMIIDPRES